MNGIRNKSKPQPEYPEGAQSAHASGTVRVEVIFDEKGKVIWAKPVSGHPLLRGAAVEAACRARFYPAQRSGEPIKALHYLTYAFVLQ